MDTLLLILLCAPAAALLLLWLWTWSYGPSWPEGRAGVKGLDSIQPAEPIDFDGVKLIHQLKRSIAAEKEKKLEQEKAKFQKIRDAAAAEKGYGWRNNKL